MLILKKDELLDLMAQIAKAHGDGWEAWNALGDKVEQMDRELVEKTKREMMDSIDEFFKEKDMEEPCALSFEDAVSMLPEGDSIHTSRQAGFTLIGADWNRDAILDALKTCNPELSGENATKSGHGLAFIDEYGVVFVQTKKS